MKPERELAPKIKPNFIASWRRYSLDDGYSDGEGFGRCWSVLEVELSVRPR